MKPFPHAPRLIASAALRQVALVLRPGWWIGASVEVASRIPGPGVP